MQKSILITGCSSGIGLCVAQGLKKQGWRVFASARKHADVENLRSQGFESLQLDLNDSLSIKTAVAKVLYQTEGKLDALFNNGGFGVVGAVEDLSRDALRAQFETNVFGWIELTNEVLPVMRRQGHGRIIMNSSILGFAAMPYRGAYNASKFAIEGFSDTLRQELHRTNIHVSLIEPGPILSQFRSNALAAFNRYIDKKNSIHQQQYESMLLRLNKEGAAAPFTLGPEAVLKRVVHALESNRPSIRYYVTVPTYLFGYLKRLLPNRVMDMILLRAGGGGKR
jgi:NAD(P)-dependent dehydrogenase (short-subunit alcohol dehydrogenase family)